LELRDLIVAPLLILIVYVVAYIIRPFVTDDINRKYFFPALTVRIIGALAVGFIYQFYYHGGDTFAFHTHGSRVIWSAFTDDIQKGFGLLFSENLDPSYYKYTSQIWYFRDPQSFFVIRITAIFDLFTFSSYCGTAVLFAVFAFTGAWALFQTFHKIYPDFHKWIAVSILFLPTVIFWGSGIFKDSLTLASLGLATYYFYQLFIVKRIKVTSMILLLLSLWMIFSIKKYILLSFLPAILLWWFAAHLTLIKSMMLKILVVPIVGIIALGMAYFTILKVAEDDPRYNISKLAMTAKITAYDIRYGWGARTGEGSGYTLGELDGTWQNMIKLAPQAINVSLFRPYLWEVKNPLMLLSALESLAFLVATIIIILLVKTRWSLIKYLKVPEVLFCLVFALNFAFAVGVSTYNFGTLSRYKIPMIPFYLVGLGLAYYHSKRDKKLEVLDNTE
jgi:hypothetical protein